MLPAPHRQPDTQNDESFGRLIPRREYAADLGVGPRWVFHIERTDPDFPGVVYRNNRAHVTDVAWARYKQILLQRGLKTASGTMSPGMLAGKAVRS